MMTSPGGHLAEAFAAAMHRMGPFEPRPTLAVAVSGGADSMALAILATDWAAARGGSILGLVVDHGLRPESSDEARITIQRLTQRGIPARVLPLSNLAHGPSLAERARIMRYQTLTSACREAGVLHLLLGHHLADQAETLAMRILRGSQTHGLAGMPALSEMPGLRLLRPMLNVEPALLRQFLTAHGVTWAEDPSNRDLHATRPRLRHRLAVHRLTETGLSQALRVVGGLRAHEEVQIAVELATRATIRPEGFALLSPGRIGPLALRSLLRTIGAQSYACSLAQIVELAAQPRPATVAGVRILHAGRFGNGLLLVREEAATMPWIAALPGVIWDNRFRLIANRDLPKDAWIGKLAADAARLRHLSDLPSTVLRTLPAIRIGKVLAAVPHLGYTSSENDTQMTLLFSPSYPVVGPSFVASR